MAHSLHMDVAFWKVITSTFYTVAGLLSQRHGLISSMVDVNPSLWLFGAAFLSSLQWNHFQCSSESGNFSYPTIATSMV